MVSGRNFSFLPKSGSHSLRWGLSLWPILMGIEE